MQEQTKVQTADTSGLTNIKSNLDLAWVKIQDAIQLEAEGHNLWIEGTLELINILDDARKRLGDQAFGTWLTDNGYGEDRITRHDRAALLNMALDLNVTRKVLEQTDRRSWRLIWEKEIQQPRLPSGGQLGLDFLLPDKSPRPAMCLLQNLTRDVQMTGHVEQGGAIVPRDAIFAIAVLDQPRPECLIAKAPTCIVQNVDEFEGAFDPEIVAFSLLLESVLDLHPSEVEFAFDVGQPAGVCGLRFDLLLHFTSPIFPAACTVCLALAANWF